MTGFLSASIYFGLLLTLVAYYLAVRLAKKYKTPFLNPILTSTIFIILILLDFKIEYSFYNESARIISYFLTPLTVCLAIPMYKELKILKDYKFPILFSVGVGSIGAIVSISLLSILFNLDSVILKSLLPKSITTAIAMPLSLELGGISSITIMSVVFTGIFGAIITDFICKVFKINNSVAVGLAYGTAAHAIGTSRAFQKGELEGAVSSIAIVIAGIFTVIFMSFAIYFM